MSFDELVGGDDLSPEEEARLRRVHELLVQAGPPPDLPPTLEHPQAPTEGEIIQFPLLPRRRFAVAAVAAALLVVVGFGGGYLVGHSKAKPAQFAARRVVAMHGQTALAVLKIAKADSGGNWPMELQVSGLASQRNRGDYYELWATKNGKITAPCGGFRVHGRTTSVRFTVPYRFENFDGWVVTVQPEGVRIPGRVVLST